MRHWIAIGVVGLTLTSLSIAGEPLNRLAAKKESWQKRLDQMTFTFPETSAGLLFSLAQYRGDCKVHMIFDPKASDFAFKFERGGVDVVALRGHSGSVFRNAGNVLFFGHFTSSSSGCSVAAYDLNTGEKLWATRLRAIGNPPHLAYSNEVTMTLPSLEKDGERVVLITGRETLGDYIEVLDLATGDILANKIYRNGLAAQNNP